jgi:hypothetical protein
MSFLLLVLILLAVIILISSITLHNFDKNDNMWELENGFKQIDTDGKLTLVGHDTDSGKLTLFE